MHTLQCPDGGLQATGERRKWSMWKKLTSISLAVCLVTVLRIHFHTAPKQLRLGNSHRKLSAPAGPADNVSSALYLLAGPSGNISSIVYLPVGLSENMSNQTYLPAGLSEDISSHGYLSGKTFDAFVSSICLCNPTSTMIFSYVSETNIWRGWITNSRTCDCSGSLAPHASEGQEVGCWYANPIGGVTNALRCQGGKFTYSRDSPLAGRYVCSGSPAVCRKQGFCTPQNQPPYCR